MADAKSWHAYIKASPESCIVGIIFRRERGCILSQHEVNMDISCQWSIETFKRMYGLQPTTLSRNCEWKTAKLQKNSLY